MEWCDIIAVALWWWIDHYHNNKTFIDITYVLFITPGGLCAARICGERLRALLILLSWIGQLQMKELCCPEDLWCLDGDLGSEEIPGWLLKVMTTILHATDNQPFENYNVFAHWVTYLFTDFIFTEKCTYQASREEETDRKKKYFFAEKERTKDYKQTKDACLGKKAKGGTLVPRES